MAGSNRFRLESGPFIMEVTGTDRGWIARVDGVGEHFKGTFSGEVEAKNACIEAAKEILMRKHINEPKLASNPTWT